ncbi:DUF4143 domain-containing protein [Amycolatopsis jejuensis]|uniref:DUF4143 domain-containing protein n=1 Tax=Amycolatopsis jejuensis TaxID=330084 RepID=UPI003CCC2282
MGQDPARLGEPTSAAGAMMENLVVMELARQLTWSEGRGRLFHYRTKDKQEVDRPRTLTPAPLKPRRSRPRCPTP